jgi:hypothetical protein
VAGPGIVYAASPASWQRLDNISKRKAIVYMKTREDIESYLLKMSVAYDDLGNDIWRVRKDGIDNLMVTLAGPIVVFRLKVMNVPTAQREALFETLLRLNTTELFHCAFGIEANAIILGGALELENLDFNEFQAVIEDIELAVAKQHPLLSKFRSTEAQAK